jgi:type II secretory pathway component PulJ
MNRHKIGENWADRRAQKGGSLIEMTIAMALGTVILVSLFSLYYVAASTAAKEESRAAATKEGRLLAMRVVKDIRLMGLFATEDIDGDSNDIDRDVPDLTWSNGFHEPIEFASTYGLVISCDIDDDSLTETVGYWPNANGIQQDIWEWQRDSVDWGLRNARILGRNIDAVLFRYYDNRGNELPASGPIPSGGHVLSLGQRLRVTAIEITLLVRSDESANEAHNSYTVLPDGRYWYDGFHREVYRFMIRGRNLNLNQS